VLFIIALPADSHSSGDWLIVVSIAPRAAQLNHEQFEDTVHRAVTTLPAWVHEALHNIDLLILDEPGPDLDPDGQGLLGLYVGIPLAERGEAAMGELPDVVYLFRKPHLELGLSGPELEAEIATTLIHEIAHYFGFDDAELERLGWG